MDIEARRGPLEVPILEVLWGSCFMFEHELWLKGKTTCIRLRDGESKDFAETVLVTRVKAKVTYENI